MEMLLKVGGNIGQDYVETGIPFHDNCSRLHLRAQTINPRWHEYKQITLNRLHPSNDEAYFRFARTKQTFIFLVGFLIVTTIVPIHIFIQTVIQWELRTIHSILIYRRTIHLVNCLQENNSFGKCLQLTDSFGNCLQKNDSFGNCFQERVFF